MGPRALRDRRHLGLLHAPILRRQHLAANAEAWKTRRKRFHVEVQGAWYRGLRTARYRVACLEALRRDYEALPEAARSEARALLEQHGGWEPLWRVDAPPSGLEGMDPFESGLSMTGLGG